MNAMDIINIINAIVLIVGLPLILKATLYIGKKLQVIDHLERAIEELRISVSSLRGVIDGPISSDIRDTKERVVALETKVNIMWDWVSRRMTLDSQR